MSDKYTGVCHGGPYDGETRTHHEARMPVLWPAAWPGPGSEVRVAAGAYRFEPDPDRAPARWVWQPAPTGPDSDGGEAD